MIVRQEWVEPGTGRTLVMLVDDSTGEILDYPGVCWAEARFGPRLARGR